MSVWFGAETKEVSSSVIFITDPAELDSREGISLFYCYAVWLPDHQQIIAMLTDVQLSCPTLKILALDIEAFADLRESFKLTKLPAFFFLTYGKKKLMNINGLSLSQIEAKIADIYAQYKEKPND